MDEAMDGWCMSQKNELSQWMNERTKEWTHVAACSFLCRGEFQVVSGEWHFFDHGVYPTFEWTISP